MFLKKRNFSLRKAKQLLLNSHHKFLQNRSKLSSLVQREFEDSLRSLESAIAKKNRSDASILALRLIQLEQSYLKEKTGTQLLRFFSGLAMALAIAMIIRQSCFELYEIPTGSMRPTFKEQDRLMVSKTSFGINVPFLPKHFYFNPDLVQRNSAVVFTAENMDLRNADTVYFYLFPGKKLLVKRLIGKPGDRLYFYGGRIYGIDKHGNDISKELQPETLSHIEHIPFSQFEGKIEASPSSIPGTLSPVIIKQMNEPIARLYVTPSGKTGGELLPKIKNIAPQIQYHNLWGFEHFAMARLLTPDQVRTHTLYPENNQVALYLELKHHPTIDQLGLGIDERNRTRPTILLSSSYIPLHETHIKAIYDNLYTSRFIVRKGFLFRHGDKALLKTSFAPYIPDIPDGTYEFFSGKAYQIKWLGFTTKLPDNHPLYHLNIHQIQTLFNTGIEFDTRFIPNGHNHALAPSRYAYFRKGDLYLMGGKILSSTDPVLNNFVTAENLKAQSSLTTKPYTPFVDKGAPYTPSGSLDVNLIQTYGLLVPEKSYFVLGDNHANSGDSREFGFVPEENLKGTPSFIFSPPGDRFGSPLQPPHPWMNLARGIVWGFIGISFVSWTLYQKKRKKLPLSF